MKAGMFIVAAACALGAMAHSTVVSAAGDLDDKISSYTDGAISKDHTLGEPEKNLKFIILDAKSRAKVETDSVTGKDHSANMNSVVLGPGTNVRGDIIIIDESKGPKTQVAQ